MPAEMTMQEIHPQQLQPHIAESKLDLIDVRTPAEYETVHIQGARTAPLQELNPDQIRSTRPPGAEGPTYVLCKSGGRAKQACPLGRCCTR